MVLSWCLFRTWRDDREAPMTDVPLHNDAAVNPAPAAAPAKKGVFSFYH